MIPTPPSIHLDSGLVFGYGTPLASVGTAVKLTAGTHFLLARNGRGKTTLLRTIAGSQKPLSGGLRVQGAIQYLPEDLRFDAEMSPSMIFYALIPKSRLHEAIELAARIELDLKKPYGRLSTGNRRKTNLVLAEFSIKANSGNILLLDEPFSGLDAFARQAFEEIWNASSDNVLRLVSCHPDYDSMVMPSVVMIEGKNATHLAGDNQTWSNLKNLLN